MRKIIRNPFQVALRFLERRARTEKELRQKLAEKQFDATQIDQTIERLKGYGYINDQKFATDFQRFRDDYKPMGVHRLKMELSQKGIPKDILETVAAPKEKEIELAWQAAQTRLRQYARLEPEVFRRRMTNFLARRGFGFEVIKRVFERLKESPEE